MQQPNSRVLCPPLPLACHPYLPFDAMGGRRYERERAAIRAEYTERVRQEVGAQEERLKRHVKDAAERAERALARVRDQQEAEVRTSPQTPLAPPDGASSRLATALTDGPTQTDAVVRRGERERRELVMRLEDQASQVRRQWEQRLGREREAWKARLAALQR